MNNKILNYISDSKNGHYVHVLELSSAYELSECVEQLYSEFIKDFSHDDIVEFFDTMTVIYYSEEGENEEDENELYNFNIAELLTDLKEVN